MTILTLSLINVAIAAALSSIVPAFTRPDLLFAVTVPAGFRRSDAGRKIVRKYLVYGWAGTALVTLLVIACGSREAALHIGVTGTLLVWFASFYLARRLSLPHAVPPDPVRVAVLSPRSESLPGGVMGVAFPFVVLALKAIEVSIRWDQIPDRFPIHWGLNGPDRWADRTPLSVYGSLLGVALICALMLFIAWGILHASRRVSTVGENAATERRFRRYNVLGLMALAYVFALTLPPIPAMYLIVPYAPFLIIATAIGLVVSLAISGQGGTRFPEYRPVLSDAAPAGDSTTDNYWKLGIIYFNRDDPALFVEKRFGMGWTVNFGNRWCWVLIAALLCWPALRMFVR
jgi:uncharacterized membrane protein